MRSRVSSNRRPHDYSISTTVLVAAIFPELGTNVIGRWKKKNSCMHRYDGDDVEKLHNILYPVGYPGIHTRPRPPPSLGPEDTSGRSHLASVSTRSKRTRPGLEEICLCFCSLHRPEGYLASLSLLQELAVAECRHHLS